MLAGVRKMSATMFGSGDHELSEKSVVDKKKVERAKSMRQSMGTALFEMDESITTLDKDALFALADKNDDNMIDRGEFDKLHEILKSHAKEQAMKELAAEAKAKEEAGRAKRYKKMLGVALGFIVLQCALNTGLTATTIFAFKDQYATMAESQAMIADANENVVATASALVHVPLYTAPVLSTASSNLFLTIKQLEVHYELLISYGNGVFGFTDPPTGGDYLMNVQGVNSHNATWVDFMGENGVMLSVKNGKAQLVLGSGENETYSVCAGTVACGAVKVPKAEAEELMTRANFELTTAGLALPPGVDGSYTEITRRALTANLAERRQMALAATWLMPAQMAVGDPFGPFDPPKPTGGGTTTWKGCIAWPNLATCAVTGSTLGYGCVPHGVCFFGVLCNTCANAGCSSWCAH